MKKVLFIILMSCCLAGCNGKDSGFVEADAYDAYIKGEDGADVSDSKRDVPVMYDKMNAGAGVYVDESLIDTTVSDDDIINDILD